MPAPPLPKQGMAQGMASAAVSYTSVPAHLLLQMAAQQSPLVRIGMMEYLFAQQLAGWLAGHK